MYFRKAIALINQETDNLAISSSKGNYPQVKFQNISYYEEVFIFLFFLNSLVHESLQSQNIYILICNSCIAIMLPV